MSFGWLNQDFGVYKEQDTVIHRLDPRVKFIWLIVVGIVIIIYKDPIWMLLFSIPAFGLVSRMAKLTWKDYKPIVLPIFSICLIAFLINQWLFFRHEHFLFYLIPNLGFTGPAVPISLESLIHASDIVSRIPLLMGPVRVFMGTTSMKELASGFTKMKFPPEVTMSISIAMGYLPVLLAQLRSVMESQMARGYVFESGTRNPVKALKQFTPLMIPLVTRSIIRAEFLAAAMVCRGFEYDPQHRTYIKEIRLNRNDKIALALIFAGLGFSVLATVMGWARYEMLTLPLAKRMLSIT
ncbi:MAG: energy-coupling factor transporter transmembrane component T [Candidatus Bathyarchaeia archaeon]